MGSLPARLWRNPTARIGMILCLAFAASALLAPLLAPADPILSLDVRHVLEPPSSVHWLGTDDLGRDVLSRLLWGGRVSLFVGFVAVGLSTLIGTLVGAVAGYYGGILDRLLMRFVDVMLCFPTFFLILAVVALLEPGIGNIMIVIGATSWMGVARLVRAEFLSLREREFLLAERALGAGDARLILRAILPNAMGPILVAATLGIAGAVLVESGLSFLGLGVQLPDPSWGNMLTVGKDTLEVAWWLPVFPGLAILCAVLGFNLFGEGLRDALDPRAARRG